MKTYKFAIRLPKGSLHEGKVEAFSRQNAHELVLAIHPHSKILSLQSPEEEALEIDRTILRNHRKSKFRKISGRIIAAVAMMVIGLLNLLLAALPVALAIVLAVLFLRSCSGK